MEDPEYFRELWQERAKSHLVLYNCKIGGLPNDGLWAIGIVGKRIFKVLPTHGPGDVPEDLFQSQYHHINCKGRTVLPGLCDAHVHVTANTADLTALLNTPESLTSAHAMHTLRAMLNRGFTTVRDCGGADWGLAKAVEEGLIQGPRLLFSGHALSQTGGHGDMRSKGEDCFACGAALRGIGRVCDGDAAVRLAARDELRKGAHCIKIMASGGVSSPTDRITNTQFSESELRAIVEEAKAAGTYVAAHAYTATAIGRAVAAGVGSIEHGNYLDAETAHAMAAAGTFLVPTLITYEVLRTSGVKAGMSQELVCKVGDLVEAGLQSLKTAKDAGVQMCFGSDLLGCLRDQQLHEFELRGRVLSPAEIIKAATENCARLFRMEDQIGKVAENYLADLIVVDGNPYEQISVLEEEANILMVIKEGVIVRNSLHKVGGNEGNGAKRK